MMKPWVDVYTLVMISALNGSRVAEYLIHSIIAAWNMFHDGSMGGFVHFGYDISIEWVLCSRIPVTFNYCDLEHVL